jgi:hypothetical protein
MQTDCKIEKNILNIVTPCSRPENLVKCLRSFCDTTSIKWHVVFDKDVTPPNIKLNKKNVSLIKLHSDQKSHWGNCLRNMALDKINSGYVYFLDDDNLMHPLFWNHFKNFEKGKFYTFLWDKQSKPNLIIKKFSDGGFYITNCSHDFPNIKYDSLENAIADYPDIVTRFKKTKLIDYLYPYYPIRNHIDSSMVCIDANLIKNSRWIEYDRGADGVFMQEVFQANKNCLTHIDKKISYYNHINQHE